MKMSELANELKKLKHGEHRIIYTSRMGVKVTVTHTARFSARDFAVGLIRDDEDEFYPTHIRLLIDLYIKRESNPADSMKLFCSLEKIYQGDDPLNYIDELIQINFPMQLDEAEVNLYVAQLLMIEQDFNFGPDAPKKSKLNPPRQYLMRFIRWIATGDTQIDKIIFAAAGRKYPAPNRYAELINCDDFI